VDYVYIYFPSIFLTTFLITVIPNIPSHVYIFLLPRECCKLWKSSRPQLSMLILIMFCYTVHLCLCLFVVRWVMCWHVPLTTMTYLFITTTRYVEVQFRVIFYVTVTHTHLKIINFTCCIIDILKGIPSSICQVYVKLTPVIYYRPTQTISYRIQTSKINK